MHYINLFIFLFVQLYSFDTIFSVELLYAGLTGKKIILAWSWFRKKISILANKLVQPYCMVFIPPYFHQSMSIRLQKCTTSSLSIFFTPTLCQCQKKLISTTHAGSQQISEQYWVTKHKSYFYVSCVNECVSINCKA